MTVAAGSARAQAFAQAQARATSTVRAQVLAYIRGQWASLGGTYSDAALDQFVSRVVPVVIAGQQQTASLTNAYIAQVVSAVTGEPAAAADMSAAEVTGAAVRVGVEPAIVYARPIVTTRTAIAAGADVASALAQGLQRAVDLASTDLQLARTHAARIAMSGNGRITGFQRVLNNPRACGLCTTASLNRYGRAELMPIHPGCDCGVAPIIGESNPGRSLDKELLAQARQAQQGPGDGAAPAPGQVDVEVRQHGEIGPVLTVAGQHFTGPRDIPPQEGGPTPPEGNNDDH